MYDIVLAIIDIALVVWHAKLTGMMDFQHPGSSRQFSRPTRRLPLAHSGQMVCGHGDAKLDRTFFNSS